MTESELDLSLRDAAREGDIEEMRYLIDAGADVDGTAFDGTALHYASLNGRTAAVKLSLEHGASVDAVDENGYTALHAALERFNVAST